MKREKEGIEKQQSFRNNYGQVVYSGYDMNS